jgi:hypothetical protein
MGHVIKQKETPGKLTRQERIQLIAQRVWELWREETRREKERRAGGRRR